MDGWACPHGEGGIHFAKRQKTCCKDSTESRAQRSLRLRKRKKIQAMLLPLMRPCAGEEGHGPTFLILIVRVNRIRTYRASDALW